MLRLLYHPNVIWCYDLFIDNSKQFIHIVLEFADGGDLKNYINKNYPFEEDEIVDLFWQACEGLNYLHSNNIIHRDIKCENILMFKDGWCVITDLGLSKYIEYSSQTCKTYCGTP